MEHSEFINFFFGIADRFFVVVNLAGHVQFISASLMWYRVRDCALPLM